MYRSVDRSGKAVRFEEDGLKYESPAPPVTPKPTSGGANARSPTGFGRRESLIVPRFPQSTVNRTLTKYYSINSGFFHVNDPPVYTTEQPSPPYLTPAYPRTLTQRKLVNVQICHPADPVSTPRPTSPQLIDCFAQYAASCNAMPLTLPDPSPFFRPGLTYYTDFRKSRLGAFCELTCTGTGNGVAKGKVILYTIDGTQVECEIRCNEAELPQNGKRKAVLLYSHCGRSSGPPSSELMGQAPEPQRPDHTECPQTYRVSPQTSSVRRRGSSHLPPLPSRQLSNDNPSAVPRATVTSPCRSSDAPGLNRSLSIASCKSASRALSRVDQESQNAHRILPAPPPPLPRSGRPALKSKPTSPDTTPPTRWETLWPQARSLRYLRSAQLPDLSTRLVNLASCSSLPATEPAPPVRKKKAPPPKKKPPPARGPVEVEANAIREPVYKRPGETESYVPGKRPAAVGWKPTKRFHWQVIKLDSKDPTLGTLWRNICARTRPLGRANDPVLNDEPVVIDPPVLHGTDEVPIPPIKVYSDDLIFTFCKRWEGPLIGGCFQAWQDNPIETKEKEPKAKAILDSKRFQQVAIFMSAMKITKSNRIVLSVHRLMERICNAEPGELPYSIENEEKVSSDIAEQCGILQTSIKAPRLLKDREAPLSEIQNNLFGPRKVFNRVRIPHPPETGANSSLGPWQFSSIRARNPGKAPVDELPESKVSQGVMKNSNAPIVQGRSATTAELSGSKSEKGMLASDMCRSDLLPGRIVAKQDCNVVKKTHHDEIGQKSTIFLTLERIEFLLRMWPSGDELDALLEARRLKQPMLPVEALLADLVAVPNIKLLAEACVERVRLEHALRDMAWSLLRQRQALDVVFEALRPGAVMTRTLEVVLWVGNFLNAGGPGGRAEGFRMASLPKLSSYYPDTEKREYVEAKDRTSLAKIVAKWVANTYGEDSSHQFYTGMRKLYPALDELAQFDLPTFEGQLEVQKTRLFVVRRKAAAVQDISQAEDGIYRDLYLKFARAIDEYHKWATAQLLETFCQYGLLMMRGADLMRMLGQNSATPPPEINQAEPELGVGKEQKSGKKAEAGKDDGEFLPQFVQPIRAFLAAYLSYISDIVVPAKDPKDLKNLVDDKLPRGFIAIGRETITEDSRVRHNEALGPLSKVFDGNTRATDLVHLAALRKKYEHLKSTEAEMTSVEQSINEITPRAGRRGFKVQRQTCTAEISPPLSKMIPQTESAESVLTAVSSDLAPTPQPRKQSQVQLLDCPACEFVERASFLSRTGHLIKERKDETCESALSSTINRLTRFVGRMMNSWALNAASSLMRLCRRYVTLEIVDTDLYWHTSRGSWIQWHRAKLQQQTVDRLSQAPAEKDTFFTPMRLSEGDGTVVHLRHVNCDRRHRYTEVVQDLQSRGAWTMTERFGPNANM